MKALKRIFNMKTIRNRIIFVQLAVVLPATILLGIILYQRTCSMLIETNSEAYEKILRSTETLLDNNLDYYRDIARNIMANDTIQRELKYSNGEETKGKMINEISRMKIQEQIEKYMASFSGLFSVYIFDNNGKLCGLDFENGSQYLQEVEYGEVSDTSWFQEGIEQLGYEKFTGYNVITKDEKSFSCIKQIRDLNSLEPIGIMVANFDKSALNHVFPSYHDEKGTYAILEQEDKIHIVAYAANASVSREQLLEILSRTDGRYHVSVYEDGETGWQFVYLIESRYIVKEAEKLRMIISEMLLVTMTVLIVLTVLACNRITRPLYQLRDNIVKVGDGERKLQSYYPDDEIGVIGQEFNKMVNDKLALSEQITKAELKNKEAELELLQSNINPHFLYNTLDSLYWMAILHEAEDIARLTNALSDVFKIALSEGEKFITVKKELDFVESYLYIQNIRFEDKIKVDIQADERLFGCKIIKLLLQPFVENAVYHGLEPKIEGGTVIIKIYEKNKFLYFEVCDNGLGMDVEDALQKGYALKNSRERVHLIYGEEARVEFFSEIGKGTRVVIRLPKEETNAAGCAN